MVKRNVTLSLPKDLVLRAKLLAVKRETSLSGLLRDLLEHLVGEEDGYVEAQRRLRNRLEKGLNLGMKGRASWSRENLHER